MQMSSHCKLGLVACKRILHRDLVQAYWACIPVVYKKRTRSFFGNTAAPMGMQVFFGMLDRRALEVKVYA